MSMDIKASFPSLNNCKIDIDKLLKGPKIKPSGVTQEELLQNRVKMDEEKAKSDSAENYWAGLYSAANSSEIDLNGNYSVSPVAISKDYTFTDPEFITNFVAKQSFYEDRIRAKYSGKELEEKLSDLDKVSNEAIDKLSEAFAKGIGDFINGDLDWLNGEAPVTSSRKNQKSQQNFNVEEFKNHIIDVVKNEKSIFENIKTQNSEEWKQVINNYGAGLKNFTAKLDSVSSLNTTNTYNKIENMSYSNIKAVGTVIDSLGDGIYTNSSEVLGAYLGQMKLKGDIMLGNLNMSNEVRQTVSSAISQNIARKIVNFSHYYNSIDGTALSSLQGKIIDSFSSFAKLSNVGIQQFRTEYSNSLENLLSSSTVRSSAYEAESPYSNKIRFANSIIEQQVSDWNNFLDKLNIDNNIKKYCYINGSSGNIIDSKS
jgi:hypothetical protein